MASEHKQGILRAILKSSNRWVAISWRGRHWRVRFDLFGAALTVDGGRFAWAYEHGRAWRAMADRLSIVTGLSVRIWPLRDH